VTAVTYRVQVTDEARNSYLSLPEKIQRQLARKIDALEGDPFPPGCKALRGKFEGLHRVRSGDYRIVYQVRGDVLLVLVVKIGIRGIIYR